LRWDVDLGLSLWLAAAYVDLQFGASGRPSMAFLSLSAYGLWPGSFDRCHDTPRRNLVMRAERDLARIDFVSRRFAELQGLASAAFGAALLGSSLMWALVEPDSSLLLSILIPANLVGVTSLSALQRYYEERFGRVRVARDTPWWVLGRPRAATAFGHLAGVVMLGLFADLLVELQGWTARGIGGWALATYSIWILIRDGRERIYYAFGVAIGGFSTFAMVSSASTYALTTPVAAIGFAVYTIGLLDHRLLLQAMHLTRTAASRPAMPSMTLARIRIAASASCLIAAGIYVGVLAGQESTLALNLALVCATCLFAVVGSGMEARNFWQRTRAYSELTTAREARLMAALRKPTEGVPEAELSREERDRTDADLTGHLLLPLAIACAAIADVILGASAWPSLLAFSLGAWHLRIVIRDWPRRRYYLLGMVAALGSSIQRVFMGGAQLEWLVWFVILVSSAVLIEGWLDLRQGGRGALLAAGRRHAGEG
jgi:hypothetical protein